MFWLIAFLVVVGLVILVRIQDSLRERRRLASPPLDRAAGNPNVAPARDLLWKQDWSGLSGLYRKQSPSDRYQFIEALGATAVIDTPLPSDLTDSGALCVAGGLK